MKNNRYLILFAVIAALFALYQFGSTKKIANYPPKNYTIVAFGDSLVQGIGATKGNDFVSLLSKKIHRPIINLGIKGQTSGDGLARIDDVLAYEPGVVIVLFGGNDFLKKVPKETTFSNLRQIIYKLQSSGAMVILLGVKGGVLGDPFRSEFSKLAKETNSLYVSDVLGNLLGDTKYLSDVVHPNDAGYEIIASKIYGKVAKYLK